VVAATIGLGLGAVLTRPSVAGVATFAPLALAVVLGGVPAVSAWLTPAASAPLLLAGNDPWSWLREVVVLFIWGGGLWVVGAGRILFQRGAQSLA
jgi:hypothetical protein